MRRLTLLAALTLATAAAAQIGPVTAQLLSDSKIQPLFKSGWGRYNNGNPAVVVVDTDPAKYTGPSWILDLYGTTVGNAIAADLVKRTQLLNEAIPALSLAVGQIILLESTLSFLGLGIQPPTPSWGNMLNNAQELIARAPELAFYPGFLIFITVIAVNFVGDGLQDAFDPRAEAN